MKLKFMKVESILAERNQTALFWAGRPGSFSKKQSKMFHNFTVRFWKGLVVVCDIAPFKLYHHKHFESNQGQRSTLADHFNSGISPSLKQPFQSAFNAVSIDPLQSCAGHFRACFLKVVSSRTDHINTTFRNRQCVPLLLQRISHGFVELTFYRVF